MNIESFKKVCVVGWGKSGVALCDLLLSLKKEVKVSEIKERSVFPYGPVDKFCKKGVKFEFGGHSHNFIKDSHLVILSPGVDIARSPIKDFVHALGIPYVGEIEFSFWLTKANCIAITGTNGKTTTSHLTYKVLKQRKKKVFLGGNIGTPFSSFVLDTKKGDIVVLEISSFQLETTIEFRPYVAALLNIEPNHLDRHFSFRDYFEAKMNIFKNQKKEDWAVINKDIHLKGDIQKRIKSQIIYFSSELPNANFSCVYRIASIFGLGKADCLKVFSEFKGIPHRLQFVREINNVTFINDSKSTNPSSTIWAFQNTKRPIILIAGGKDKGVDYSAIVPYLKKVKKVNLFGQAAEKIKKALEFHIETELFASLKDVVFSSYQEASAGDVVLFSPMCSSFDMFLNYEDRGDKFIKVVSSIK
jgi:UDP-N-acetylmuramoylalanine--D-glutamate ligase